MNTGYHTWKTPRHVEHPSVTENCAHRAAEDLHRKRRIDRDRIIAVALDILEDKAREETVDGVDRERIIGNYIAGSAGIEAPWTNEANKYALELLAEIRAQLSPLVRKG